MTKNCCRRFLAPCAACCHPLAQQCRLGPSAALDFELDGQPWKSSFGKPSGLSARLLCGSTAAFVLLRVGLFFFWLGVMIWSMVDWVNTSAWVPIDRDDSSPECADGVAGCEQVYYGYGYWFTQLTHWTLLFELVYLGFAAVTTALANYSSLPDGTGDETPWFVSVTWAMQPAALVASCLVFVLYWALLYSPGDEVHAISVVTHGVNFAVMLLDFLICRQPLYLAHITMPLAYSLSYLVFSAIYYAAGGTYHRDRTSRYIYDVLDWSSPSGPSTLSALIVLLVVPFLYLIFIVLYAWRLKCSRSAGVGPAKQTAPDSADVGNSLA